MSVENEDRISLNGMPNMNNMNMITDEMMTNTISANEMRQYNNNSNYCDNKNETKEEMLKKIKCLQFAIIELALYLDTHPDDEKALCLHNKYCKEFKELKDKYQKVYGPLTYNYPCNKWRWLEEPWPWEGGIN